MWGISSSWWGRHRSPARGIELGHSLHAELCDGGCLVRSQALWDGVLVSSWLCCRCRCAAKLQLISLLLWVLQPQRDLSSLWYSVLQNLAFLGLVCRESRSLPHVEVWSAVCPTPKVAVVSLHGHVAILG